MYGGYSYGSIEAAANSISYIIVGRQGYNGNTHTNYRINGGYNGGGTGNVYTGNNQNGGGGGATHISTYNCGELKNCSAYKSNILIVAGGGGGGSNPSVSCGHPGGVGGGYVGGASTGGQGQSTGGDQDSGGIGQGGSHYSGGNGSFGLGGSSAVNTNPQAYCGSSGGGGGWYGGGGGGYNAAGGGGSGYLNTSKLVSDSYRMYCYASGNGACPTNSSYYTYAATGVSSTATANYAKQGNGYARITYLGTSI